MAGDPELAKVELARAVLATARLAGWRAGCELYATHKQASGLSVLDVDLACGRRPRGRVVADRWRDPQGARVGSVDHDFLDYLRTFDRLINQLKVLDSADTDADGRRFMEALAAAYDAIDKEVG